MTLRRRKLMTPPGEHVVLWCGCELSVTRTRRSTRTRRVVVDTGRHCAMSAHTLGASLCLSQMLPAAEQLVPSRKGLVSELRPSACHGRS